MFTGSATSTGQNNVAVLTTVGTYCQAYGGAFAANTHDYDYNNTEESSVRWLDLIPTTLLQNPTYYTAQNESSLEKIVLKHVTINMKIWNDSTTPCSVDLYVLQAKRNITRVLSGGVFPNYGADRVWQDALTAESQHAVQVGHFTGVPAGTLVGGEAPFMPFASPAESREFRKTYKILKVHHLDFAGSANENVSFKVTMNKVFDYMKDMSLLTNVGFGSPAQTADADNTFKMGLAVGGITIMAVALGSPVRDSSASGGGNNVVTLSVPNLAYVINKKHKFELMKNTVKKFTTTQGYSQLIVDAPVASQAVINILDSVDVPKVA